MKNGEKLKAIAGAHRRDFGASGRSILRGLKIQTVSKNKR
jgi:hypothetical protein